MFSYRPDQGVFARGIAFWGVTAYAWYAGRSLYYWMQRFDFANHRIGSGEIPVVGMDLTPGLMIALLVFAAVTFAAWKLTNHPKIADLLVDTESEMKKVTWPSFDETKKSSLVVIGCVAFLLVFLSFTDMALEWVMSRVVFG